MEILTFRIDAMRWAVPLASVVEVVRAVAVTPLPHVAQVIDGVIDVRGELLPVVDLGQRAGLGRRPVTPAQHFVLVRDRSRTVALRVDEAEWVVSADPGAIQPIQHLVQGGAPVTGVAALPGGVTLIHDIDAFLTEAERASLREALA